MFLVELMVSSFLDLISKQATRNAAVSVFLFELKDFKEERFPLAWISSDYFESLLLPQ